LAQSYVQPWLQMIYLIMCYLIFLMEIKKFISKVKKITKILNISS